jgi:hypothetical protein
MHSPNQQKLNQLSCGVLVLLSDLGSILFRVDPFGNNPRNHYRWTPHSYAIKHFLRNM